MSRTTRPNSGGRGLRQSRTTRLNSGERGEEDSAGATELNSGERKVWDRAGRRVRAQEGVALGRPSPGRSPSRLRNVLGPRSRTVAETARHAVEGVVFGREVISTSAKRQKLYASVGWPVLPSSPGATKRQERKPRHRGHSSRLGSHDSGRTGGESVAR